MGKVTHDRGTGVRGAHAHLNGRQARKPFDGEGQLINLVAGQVGSGLSQALLT